MDYFEAGKVMGLFGKVVVVAGGGGAKNGIGRATAILFSKLGAQVAVLDINKEAAAETARMINEVTENAASIWQVDLTDEAQIDRVVTEILQKYSYIHVWAHIAGGHMGATLIEEIPPAVWKANFDLNITSPFLCVRRVLPVMKQQKEGKIVLLSSMGGQMVTTPSADYASAKAGIMTFIRQLAFEGGPFNVYANAVAPGPTHEPDPERDRKDPRLSKVPLGRFSSPDDQAKAIVFLCSSWADMITGVTLTVDGGTYLGSMDYKTYLEKHKKPAKIGKEDK